MSGDHFQEPFPRGVLVGAGILLAVVISLVGAVRLAGGPPDDLGATTQRMALRFIDRSDGSITVIDADTGREVASVASGDENFLRATLRGLARDRKRSGEGPEAPFVLAVHADGRLTLEDTATGRRIPLDAFGATNTQSFARFLAVAETDNGRIQ
jgi:putative photosynthetic complex assembly protein